MSEIKIEDVCDPFGKVRRKTEVRRSELGLHRFRLEAFDSDLDHDVSLGLVPVVLHF
jgi:hypothetical protein